jgi:hypothetical protein
VLRLWALAWLVILIAGAIVFGQSWIGAADPFVVYASTLVQMSIFRRVGDQMRLVDPLAGLNAWDAPSGPTAVVAALLTRKRLHYCRRIVLCAASCRCCW